MVCVCVFCIVCCCDEVVGFWGSFILFCEVFWGWCSSSCDFFSWLFFKLDGLFCIGCFMLVIGLVIIGWVWFFIDLFCGVCLLICIWECEILEVILGVIICIGWWCWWGFLFVFIMCWGWCWLDKCGERWVGNVIVCELGKWFIVWLLFFWWWWCCRGEGWCMVLLWVWLVKFGLGWIGFKDIVVLIVVNFDDVSFIGWNFCLFEVESSFVGVGFWDLVRGEFILVDGGLVDVMFLKF